MSFVMPAATLTCFLAGTEYKDIFLRLVGIFGLCELNAYLSA